MKGFAMLTLLMFSGTVMSIEELPLLGGCGREFAPAPIDVNEMLRELNTGAGGWEEGVMIGRDQPTELPCSEGPLTVEHTLPNKVFVPKIYKESCTGLPCDKSRCFADSVQISTQCVHVFAIVNGQYIYKGQQVQVFENDRSCSCKRCSDMITGNDCLSLKQCPESDNPTNFCYWTPYLTIGTGPDLIPEGLDLELPTLSIPFTGKCRCCTPLNCPPNQIFNPKTCSCVCNIQCPAGQIVNRILCTCECPRGTYLGSNGHCIGECSKIDLSTCRDIKCSDNTDLNCYVANGRCNCPSCDSVPHGSYECTRTKCVEQKSKPYCKIDPCSGSCRCPNCEEQPDPTWCSNTFCGPNYSSQCSWNRYSNSCSCGRLF